MISRYSLSKMGEQLRMVDVGEKPSTQRRAQAVGCLRMGEPAFFALSQDRLPKGDAFAVGRLAGIQAAKNASQNIPLCHPLPLDSVRIDFQLKQESSCLWVRCEVAAHCKTGVEMEALAGVHGALLGVYDLVKGVDAALEIVEIYLEEKQGGKTGYWRHPKVQNETERFSESSLKDLNIGLLTISDRAYAAEMEDRSGLFLERELQRRGAKPVRRDIVSDDRGQIQERVLSICQQEDVDLLICSGGTGLGPRDQTPEVLCELSDRVVPGVGELLRLHGARSTPYSWISRSIGVMVKSKLVVALPGSAKAVEESLEALELILPHAAHIQKGGKH